MLPPTAFEHSYRRLRAIPAAHRDFNASSYFRDAGDKGKEPTKSALDALEEGAKNDAEASDANKTSTSSSKASKSSVSPSTSTSSDLSQATDDWESNPNWNITNFKELPHKNFGVNQHIASTLR